MLSARFKIIELISLLHTDTIFKVKDVIKHSKKKAEKDLEKETNFFKRRKTILKLKSLDSSVAIHNFKSSLNNPDTH